MSTKHRGPRFAALVEDLKAQMAREHAPTTPQPGDAAVAKAMAARENAERAMARAMELFKSGRLTAADIATLHAVRLQHEDIV